jgi:hypothetical protein
MSQSKVKVFDNYLDIASFTKLQYSILDSDKFQWNYSPQIAYPDDKFGLDKHQFYHLFFLKEVLTSSSYPIILNLVDKINPSDLIRVKANLGTRTSSHVEGGFHTDTKFKHNTAIFYLNTNNGYTKFEDGTIVDSVANRLVVFDSDLMHSGFSQTDTNARFVINFNYKGGLSYE